MIGEPEKKKKKQLSFGTTWTRTHYPEIAKRRLKPLGHGGILTMQSNLLILNYTKTCYDWIIFFSK